MPIINSPTPDATTTTKGKVQLSGNLGGTAASPTVVSTTLSSALPVLQGGTGVTTSTGTGAVVLGTSPTLTTPIVSQFGSASGLGASWASWTPTFTGMTGGTLNQGRSIQIGKTVFYRFKYTLAGAGISASVTFTLPVTANSDYSADVDHPIGSANYIDSGTQLYRGFVMASSTTVGKLALQTVSGANIIGTGNLSATSPFTWGAADYIIVEGQYEAA